MAKWSGTDLFEKRQRALSRRGRDALFRGVFAAADLIRAGIVNSITSGSVSGARHVPSFPGEPPKQDTGQLTSGIVTVAERDQMRARVVSTAPYGPYLEYGTSRMAARPFMRPGLRNNKAAALDLIRRATRNATQGV